MRENKQWPMWREYPYSPELFGIRIKRDPNKYISCHTIPQLLDHADMIRMAVYNYGNGVFITPTKKEKEKNPYTDMYWEFSYGIYLYPENHIFHKLQPPTPDTERASGCHENK